MECKCIKFFAIMCAKTDFDLVFDFTTVIYAISFCGLSVTFS